MEKVLNYFQYLMVYTGPYPAIPSPCESFLYVNCPEKVDPKLDYQFTCKFISGNCEELPRQLHFNKVINNVTQRLVTTPGITHDIKLDAYSYPMGKNFLTCTTDNLKTPDQEVYNLTTYCEISIFPQKPTAKIKGKPKLIVPTKTIFFLDGSESINNDDNSHNLTYYFKCAELGTRKNKRCEKIQNLETSYLQFSKEDIGEVEVIMHFELQVVSPFNMADTTNVTVMVRNNLELFDIVCEENGPMNKVSTDTTLRTVIKLYLYEDWFVSPNVIWSVSKYSEKVPTDDPKEFSFSADKLKMIIHPGTLSPGSIYVVMVVLPELEGSKQLTLNIENFPVLKSCDIKPETGVATITYFKIKCENEIKSEFNYNLYCIKDQNSEEELVTKLASLDEKFRLPKTSLVYIKLSYMKWESDEFYRINVDVTELLNLQNESDIIGVALANNNTKEAVNLLHVESDKITQLAGQNPDFFPLKVSMDKHILETLSQIPLDSISNIQDVTKLALHISNSYHYAQPEITTMVMSICKNAAEHFANAMKTGGPLSENDVTLGMLGVCLSIPLKTNYDLLDELVNGTIDLNITSTLFPPLKLYGPEEDYDDYRDDQNLSMAAFQFLEAVTAMEHVCYTNGKTIADHGIEDYGWMYVTQGDMTIAVFKNRYNSFAKKVVQGRSATLETSTNGSKYPNDDFFVVFCTTKKNPYWWLLDNVYHTAVAYVQYNNTPEMRFDAPYLISFETFDLTRDENVGDVFDNIFVYNGMVSYRVSVYSSYQIQFINLTDEYTVLITEFVKPTLRELKQQGVTIDPNNSVLVHEYQTEYHSWHYVNILMENKNSTPTFLAATYGCYKWNRGTFNWEFACPGAGNSTDQLITCKCFRTSILKALREYNDVQMETVVKFNFQLELEPVFVIAVVLLLLLIVFYLFFFIINKKGKMNILDLNIVFVADVPRYCRYAYLVIVHTNSGRKDGTTSNIVIKLVGDQSSSKEHVLNYPDPRKKFLQTNNEDWFILGTEKYLGNIKKMEIWFDSVGLSPNWGCKSFEVYDLQQDKYWYFKARKLFSLDYMNIPKYEVEPFEDHEVKEKKKYRCKFKIRTKPHFWFINTQNIAGLSKTFRLITVYSIIMTLMLLSLMWNGLPQFQDTDALNPYIHFIFDYNVVLLAMGCSCLTFLIHGPLVILYRCLNISEYKESRKYKRVLMRFCRVFIIGNIISCNTLLLIYGTWISKVSSFMLLSATLGGILIYIFIFENLMKLTFTYVSDKIKRLQFIRKLKYIILRFTENERDFLYRNFGWTGLRPHLVHLYKPLTNNKFTIRQDWSKEKLNIIAFAEDLIMYLVYIFLLYVVLMSDRQPSFIYNNMHLLKIIKTKGYFNSFTLWQLNNYLKDELLDVIQSATWYPHYTSIEPGLMSDKHNYYFGVIRFRQLRTSNLNCSSRILMFFPNCKRQPEYYEVEETRNLSRRWRFKEINKFDRMHEMWLYNTENVTGSAGFSGQVCSYGGGGYVASLGRTYVNSQVNIKYCIRNNWMDTLTRVMFVEFLTYNVHTNLFNAVQLTLEYGATGVAFHNLQVDTARLLFREEDVSVVILIIFVAFIAIVSILLVRILIFIYLKRKIIFRDFHFWLCIDVCVVAISVVCIWLHATKVVKVREFLQELELRKLNEFVSYGSLFSAAGIFNCFAGFLICIATIRLWKLLRSLTVFHMIETTLLRSMAPVVSLVFGHMILVIGYTVTGYIMFGDGSKSFNTFERSFMTLIICSIGQNKRFDFSIIKTTLGYIYYSSFMIFSLLIYKLYITIVIVHYKIVQMESSTNEHYTLKKYISSRIACFFELLLLKVFKRKKRVRGGADHHLAPGYIKAVTPKADERRYKNVITLSDHKLLTMNLITQSLIRKDKMSKKQIKCLSHLIWALHTHPRQEKHLFFLDKSDRNNYKVVDDYKMLRMAHICGVLLDPARASHEGRKVHETAMFEKVMGKHLQELNKLEDYMNKVSDLIVAFQSKLDEMK